MGDHQEGPDEGPHGTHREDLLRLALGPPVSVVHPLQNHPRLVMLGILLHEPTHTHTNTRTHARTHARMHTRTHTQKHTHTNTPTHARMHAHTHMNARTHARTHACAHTHTTWCYTQQCDDWRYISWYSLMFWLITMTKWKKTINLR